MVCDTLSSQDESTHQIWDSYLLLYKRYAPDTIILKTRSEVKVTVTRKWYATLCHLKMHPHTKFGIPTSKNIGDMHRTRSGTDGLTDGLTDGRTVRILYASQSSFGGIKKRGSQNYIHIIEEHSGRPSDLWWARVIVPWFQNMAHHFQRQWAQWTHPFKLWKNLTLLKVFILQWVYELHTTENTCRSSILANLS